MEELGYYTVTFDLEGEASELYNIKAVPRIGGRELKAARYLGGEGISQPCSPGRDRQLFWNPLLEGEEPQGWQFELSVVVLEWVYVEGGSFMMGSNDGEDDVKPVHKVTVSPFWIGKYEVTVEEFREFVDDTGYRTDAERKGGAYIWNGSNWEQKSDANWRNPYFPQNDRHPVTCISWYDALTYCNWRSGREGLRSVYSIKGGANLSDWSKGEIICDWTANGYRLPTEAEWEFAALGGVKSKGYKYSGSNDVNLDLFHR